MDQLPWISQDPMDCMSSCLKEELSSAVHQLYTYKLEDSKEKFDELIRKIEAELTVNHSIVDDFSLKLARDLKGYVCLEDAIWLLDQRVERAIAQGGVGTKFRAFVNCCILAEQSDDASVMETLSSRLKSEANLSDDPVKALLANVMLIMTPHRYTRAKEMKQELEDIKVIIGQESFASLMQEACDENLLYLILAFERFAFLLRKTGDNDGFQLYQNKALSMCQRREWDLGLQMELQTNLIRALKSRGTLEDMSSYINSLLLKIQQALQDTDRFEVRYGIKVLRDAYNDVSVACSFHLIAQEQLLSTGEKLYASWKDTYGVENHEVLFIASQLIYNYESFELEEDANKYLSIVENSLDLFPETTKIIMQAKAKALIHVWKTYSNRDQLDKAEHYCREELRVNRKHGLSQQYVANSLRNLAFLIRDQERWEEGLQHLKECLQLSKEHNPGLIAFHQKVENEIRKF